MIVIAGVSLLGWLWAIAAFTAVVVSIITGKKPSRGGPRRHAGLRWRHTRDTRWK